MYNINISAKKGKKSKKGNREKIFRPRGSLSVLQCNFALVCVKYNIVIAFILRFCKEHIEYALFELYYLFIVVITLLVKPTKLFLI